MTGWTLLLAAMAAAFTSLALPQPIAGRALRRSAWAPVSRTVVIGALGLVVVGGWLVTPHGVGAVMLLGVVVAGISVRRLAAQVAARHRRDSSRRRVLEFCDALTAELQAGLPAPTALERACEPWPELAPVRAAGRIDGDVPGALRILARTPGSAGLAAVAAAWDVAARSGAGLAVVVEKVTESLRHDADAAAEVTAALGPPRATARMLLVLPVLGVGLGMSMGANPLDFLLTTAPGLGCLFVGVLLALVGVIWVERLAARAEE
jgi:tight adherence protein B